MTSQNSIQKSKFKHENKNSQYKKEVLTEKKNKNFEFKNIWQKIYENTAVVLNKVEDLIEIEKICDNEVATEIIENGEIYLELNKNNKENYHEVLDDVGDDNSIASLLKVQDAKKETHVKCSIETKNKEMKANFKTEGKGLTTIEQSPYSDDFFLLEHDKNKCFTHFTITDKIPNNTNNTDILKVKFDDVDLIKNNIFVSCKQKLGLTLSEAKKYVKENGTVIKFKGPIDN